MIKNNYTRRLVLIDAHAVLHRAYHALPDFSSSKGEPTGGLYGLSAMLIKIIADLKPDYLVACYDLPEPTFRKQVYENYKAGRKKTDDSLIAQIDRSRDIFTAFGVPIYDQVSFEADDVIGTIVEQTKNQADLEVVIASGDMDTLQLVIGDKVKVYTLKKGINDTIMYDEKEVVARFGFAPIYLPDYKGFRGDPSDNIIGVKGIGEKTATTLISTFGTVEKVYQVLKKHPERLIELGVSKRLVDLLRENEEEAIFSKTLATIRRDVPITFKLPEQTWREEFKLEQVEKLFAELEFRTLALRLKTSLGLVEEVAIETKVSEEVPSSEKVADDELEKTAIALWLIDSNKTSPTLEDIYQYAGVTNFTDAQAKIFADLDKYKLRKVYDQIELPIRPIIKRARERGILVDTAKLNSLSVKYHEETKKLEAKIYQLAGREFNLNSPKQLGEILFDELDLKVKGLKKTAGGARSTRESELQKLASIHPIIEPILAYRELQKLLTTYIDNLPAMLDEYNRLHTNLNQAGTTTGRMSSDSPNLQNIPIRDGVGLSIREAFIAMPGHLWIGSDYSQIEMRVLAILAKEDQLIKIFNEGADVHASVASLVFGVPAEQVTKDMRRQAKVINFGIIYGMGVNALKQNLGSTREEAQKFYDDYFVTFPKIKQYFDRVISNAYELGYTETLFGRKRYFPALKSKLPYLRAQAERMAMNAPIQGTATGDIIKLAIKKVDDKLIPAGLITKCHFLLQVHDELIYEVEEEVVSEAMTIIKKAMEAVVDLAVPLSVNISTGRNWAELK